MAEGEKTRPAIPPEKLDMTVDELLARIRNGEISAEELESIRLKNEAYKVWVGE